MIIHLEDVDEGEIELGFQPRRTPQAVRKPAGHVVAAQVGPGGGQEVKRLGLERPPGPAAGDRVLTAEAAQESHGG